MANELMVEGTLDLSRSNIFKLAKSISDPGGASEGDMYYNTSSFVVRIYQNGTWQNFIASPSSTSLPITEIFTLSNTDISNKYVVLSNVPSNPVKTILEVIGGPTQGYGSDFIVLGNQLNWNNLFLDGVLSSGDQLIVQHD